MSEIPNSDYWRLSSAKTWAGSAIFVDGRATSLVPTEEAIWPSGKRTRRGLLMSWISSVAATASVLRMRIQSEPVSAEEEGRWILIFIIGATGESEEVEEAMLWIWFSLGLIKVLTYKFLLRWILTVLSLWPGRQPRTLELPPARVRWSVAAKCCAVYCRCALALRTLQFAPMWLFW